MSPKSRYRFSDKIMLIEQIMISIQLSGTFLPWE
jgi:hypothetical protein